MATQVFRTEPRSSLSGALVDHLQGRTRPGTALERTDGADVIVLDAQGDPVGDALADQTLRDARAWAVACERRRREKARRKGGRPPKLFRDAFFQGPRTSDRNTALKFAKDCIQWINDVYGRGSRMATASVHLDEAVPHVHVSHAVADPDGLPGWSAVERSSRVGGGKLKGRDFLSALQDDFHAAVGERWGLARGEVGSKARHEPIDRAKSAASRVEVLERDLADVRFDLDETRKLLDRQSRTSKEWAAMYERATSTASQHLSEVETWRQRAHEERDRANAAEAALADARAELSRRPAGPEKTPTDAERPSRANDAERSPAAPSR